MAITTLSNDYRINSLLVGTEWAVSDNAPQLTYSLPEGSDTVWKNNYKGGEPNTWSALNNTQANQFRQALGLIDEVIALSIVEVDDNASTQGDIRVAYSQAVDQKNAIAWAYVPTDFGVLEESGDVWLDPDLTDFSVGSVGFSTFLHETAHGLGLKHPFEATNGNSAILTGVEDSTQYSVMSYTDYTGVGYNYIDLGGGRYQFDEVQPSTLMLYDILALQYLYGVDTTTRTGDDVYTLSNRQGELKTLWDAGGNDTFDLSNQTVAMTINLNEGAFSSVGVQQTSFNGALTTANNNVAIAFGTQIENAIGGSNHDMMTGNALDNVITGGAGNDQIDGGDGIDTVVFSGARNQYTIVSNETTIGVSAKSGNDGSDTLRNVERLQFSDQIVTLGETKTAPTSRDEVETSVSEGDSNHTNYFLLELSEALTTDAQVNYTTRDGTATAGEDYIASSGVATISAGQTAIAIGVEIIGDNNANDAASETFSLVITNPVGGIFPTGLEEVVATHTILDDDAVSAKLALQLQGVQHYDELV
ncbi:MAG: M10 family metallopeptidase C-terminal domain-containing protein [bacterium]